MAKGSVDELNLKRKHQDTLTESLEKMRKRSKMTDVSFECTGGTIHAHKFVLSAASSFFQDMFRSNCIESKCKTIAFNGCSSQAMNVIISFLYTGEIPAIHHNSTSLLLEVIAISNMMRIPALSKIAWNHQAASMDKSNCVDIWNGAIRYNDTEVQNLSASFISEHLWEMLKIRNLSELTLAQVKSVIDLEGDLGDDTAKFLFAWVKRDSRKRSKEMTRLFNKQIVSKLSDKFLKSVIENDECLKLSELRRLFVDEEKSPARNLNTCMILIHFYFRNKELNVDQIQTYYVNSKHWNRPITIPFNSMTSKLETSCKLMVCENLFYLTSTGGNSIVEINSKDKEAEMIEHNLNPDMAFHVFHGNTLHIWTEKSFVKLLVKKKTFKSLSTLNTGRGINCIPFCTCGKIFLVNLQTLNVYSYNSKWNEWQLKTNCPEADVLPIFSYKCFSRFCSYPKLHFMSTSKDRMLSYHLKSKVWDVIEDDKFKERDARCVCCDFKFIVFSEPDPDLYRFYLYHIVSGEWESLPRGFALKGYNSVDIGIQ